MIMDERAPSSCGFPRAFRNRLVDYNNIRMHNIRIATMFHIDRDS